MPTPVVEPGQVYRHFKGARYEIVLIATDTETDADMVVYRDLKTGRAFVRSLAMFLSPKVFDDGKEVERFSLEKVNGPQSNEAGEA
jgi:hypothetical protein